MSCDVEQRRFAIVARGINLQPASPHRRGYLFQQKPRTPVVHHGTIPSTMNMIRSSELGLVEYVEILELVECTNFLWGDIGRMG